MGKIPHSIGGRGESDVTPAAQWERSRAKWIRVHGEALGEPWGVGVRTWDGEPSPACPACPACPVVAPEISLGFGQVVRVVEEAEDAAAFAGYCDAHGGVGGAEEHVVAGADDVPGVGR